MSQMQTGSLSIGNQIVPVAFKLLGSLFLIQFALRNYKLVFEAASGGEFMPAVSKLIMAMIWVGFLTYLITNHYDVLNQIFSSFVQLGQLSSGGTSMNPGDIMELGITLQNNLVAAFNAATGANDGLIAAMKNFFPSLMLSVACIAILLAFFLISLAVAIATLEFYMIAAAAPIAFATGGLDALKQASIAPLQTMLSVGYRILILGVIVGMVHKMAVVWDASFSGISANDWTVIWEAVFGSGLAAVAAFSAGKIAGSLASGQSNLSGNDAMFAGLQMVNTIANATTAIASAAAIGANALQSGAGMAGKAMGADGAQGLGNMLGKGYVSMADAFPGGSKGGTMSNASPGGAAGGTPSNQRVANELLGPMGSGFTAPPPTSPDAAGSADMPSDKSSAPTGETGQDKAPTPAGDASDASIGAPTGGGAGSPTNSGDANLHKTLEKINQSLNSGGQSHANKLASAGMEQLSGMHGNDAGAVHVHIDPRAAGE
ncbi:type IV secretion system protein [Trinickia mobilis]|uniref:type IV secretion system protein n=1 Tax=Trinickia mobilis TaxID=2816356 RepID=UPI001A8D7195|nr:type IV secretion system protein [Trinickia mobilis]